jgi:hypothetical protein
LTPCETAVETRAHNELQDFSAADGRDRVLRIAHPGGQSLLMLE